MKSFPTKTRRAGGAFTLVEMAVSMAIAIAVVVGTLDLFIFFLRSYNAATLLRNASTRASMGLERMVYGVGTNLNLREAAASQVAVSTSNNYWQITYNTNFFFRYSGSAQEITDQSGKIICTNVLTSTLAYNTNGCWVSLTVTDSGGGRTVTNTMATFVKFRN